MENIVFINSGFIAFILPESFCIVFCTSKVFQKVTAHTGVAILKLTINLPTIRKQGKILFKYKYKMLQSLPDSPLQTYQSVMNITLWQNKRDTQLFSLKDNTQIWLLMFYMELYSDRTLTFSLASCNRMLSKKDTNKNVTECKSL